MARRGSRPAIRLISLLACFCAAFSLVAVRLVQLQVVQAEPLEARGAQQRVRSFDIPAKRGAIFDRTMTPLAVSTEAREIIADPAYVADPREGARLLAPILRVSRASLERKLSGPGRFVYLKRKASPREADEVLALGLPYLLTQRAMQRSYPNAEVAGHVLGFVGIDDAGLAGLEFAYEELLSGEPGEEIVEQDPAGRPIPTGRHSVREPVPGRGLVLTIDRDLQFFAESALARGVSSTRARTGVAIVMDPASGEVLAMANHPPVDPQAFASASADQRRNRATTDSYEPGSIQKLVTAAAALESGVVDPSTMLTVPDRIQVGGRTFRDFQPHPTWRLTYAESIARSSNVATIDVAVRVGEERLFRMLKRFGFGQAVGVGFPGEGSGILPPRNRWSGTSMATIPMGQGVAVTPLQMASVYATIANGGVRVQPSLVRGMVEPDGSITRPEPPGSQRVISSYTAARLRGMLVGVVEHGTGARAQIPGYVVGGKTGTAYIPRTDRPGYTREIITSFVGMAPADDPRFVVLVSLENPGPRFASLTAAPVWREITAYALAKMGVPPTVERPDRAFLLGRRAPAGAAPEPPAPRTPEAVLPDTGGVGAP